MVSQLRRNLKCCILFLLVVSCLAHNPYQDNQKVCGEILNDVLDMLCKKGFSKRLRRHMLSIPDLNRAESPMVRALRHTKLGQILMNRDVGEKETDTAPLGRFNRRRRDVARECCSSECTYDNIADYCM